MRVVWYVRLPDAASPMHLYCATKRKGLRVAVQTGNDSRAGLGRGETAWLATRWLAGLVDVDSTVDGQWCSLAAAEFDGRRHWNLCKRNTTRKEDDTEGWRAGWSQRRANAPYHCPVIP